MGPHPADVFFKTDYCLYELLPWHRALVYLIKYMFHILIFIAGVLWLMLLPIKLASLLHMLVLSFVVLCLIAVPLFRMGIVGSRRRGDLSDDVEIIYPRRSNRVRPRPSIRQRPRGSGLSRKSWHEDRDRRADENVINRLMLRIPGAANSSPPCEEEIPSHPPPSYDDLNVTNLVRRPLRRWASLQVARDSTLPGSSSQGDCTDPLHSGGEEQPPSYSSLFPEGENSTNTVPTEDSYMRANDPPSYESLQ